MIYIPAAVVVHAQWRSPAEAARAERGYAAGIGAFIVPRIKKRDWYGASLGPRLLWHLGLRPVCAGLVQRKPERVASGLRYLTGIPRGSGSAGPGIRNSGPGRLGLQLMNQLAEIRRIHVYAHRASRRASGRGRIPVIRNQLA